MSEKRKGARKKSFLRGIVYFSEMVSPVECLVRDISETGARLKLPDRQPRAGTLDLFIPINGKKFKAVVRWHDKDEIGIAFETDDKNAAAGNGKAGAAASDKAKNAAVSVLIVDDSRTTASAITTLLKNLGFTDVDVALDGHTALEVLRQKQYGLILSDWEMEPMNGEEFLKRMRLDPRSAKIPVILVTAKAGRGTSWLAGASAYLPKPFSEGDLQNAIKRVFFLKT